MICSVVELRGGFGNQLFQLALALRLHQEGVPVVLDGHFVINERGRIAIEEAFGNLPVPVTQVFWGKISAVVSSALHRLADVTGFRFVARFSKVLQIVEAISLRAAGRKNSRLVRVHESSWAPSYHEYWRDDDSARYYFGFWQNPKYTETIRPSILALYRDMVKTYFGSRPRPSPNSVAIHIRMGDYLSPQNQPLFGNIATLEYYKKATSFLKEKVPDCHFLVFSNDPTEAQKFLAGLDVPFALVETPPIGGDFCDFVLMSSCEHQIIANSTYSWWAAYLNTNPHKTVIAPQRWINDCEHLHTGQWNHVVPDHWIRL